MGKVRDIKLIREIKTKRSKGIAYIEFYYYESVTNSLALNNKRFLGQNIYVTPSQSERNRGQVVTRTSKPIMKPASKTNTNGVNQCGIIVKNLVGRLAKMDKTKIKEFFGAYGEIEYIDMEMDNITRLNKGYAIILYSRVQDAKTALLKMNGFELSGQVLMVSHVPSYMCLGGGGNNQDGNVGSKQARMYMINKLARGDKLINQDIGII